MFSVIVATSPGREAQLQSCLEQLCCQRGPDFEVLVVDDGSSGAEAVTAAFAERLSLRYNWRPNDQCPARSRNLGAKLARHQALLFIDSDILLSPQALAAYARHLQTRPEALLYGYVGYESTAVSESALQPGIPVHWRDPRFGWNGDRLVPADKLYHSAYECAFAGNFALSRDVFLQIGGFDERFAGWGGEDLDFGERAVQAGFQIHFLLDAWGEHQQHGRSDAFHEHTAEARGHGYVFRPHPAMPYQVCTLADPEALSRFEQLIRKHYLKSEKRLPAL